MKSLQLALFDSAIAEEHVIIKERLLTTTQCLGGAWQVVTPGVTNDLLCIWVATEPDLMKLQRVEKLCPAHRLIVLTNIKLDTQAKWQLFIAEEQIYPSVLCLVNLLSRVQAHFFPDSQAPQQRFDPFHSFTGILQTALVDGIARMCTIPTQADIYLLPHEKTIYVNGDIETLIPMMLTPREQITVQEITDQELLGQVNYAKFSSRLSSYAAFLDDDLFNNDKSKHYSRYSFTELIWFSTFIASRGNLLNGINLDEILFLEETPQFLVLNYSEFLPDFRLLSHLNLATILALPTEKSRYEIISFYNACALIPDIKRIATSTEKPIQNQYSFSDLQSILMQQVNELPKLCSIMVAGDDYVGKSTMIETIGSQIPTELINTEEFAEIKFGDNSSLLFYEIAQQTWFDYSPQDSTDNAFGMLILINNTEIEPFDELNYYIDLYETYFNKTQIAIGVTHLDITDTPTIDDYKAHLNDFLHCKYPILAIDPRQISECIGLVISLLKYQP